MVIGCLKCVCATGDETEKIVEEVRPFVRSVIPNVMVCLPQAVVRMPHVSIVSSRVTLGVFVASLSTLPVHHVLKRKKQYPCMSMFPYCCGCKQHTVFPPQRCRGSVRNLPGTTHACASSPSLWTSSITPVRYGFWTRQPGSHRRKATQQERLFKVSALSFSGARLCNAN